MTHAPSGAIVPTLKSQDLACAVPVLEETFQLKSIDFGQFPGPHMNFERVLELAAQVRAEFQAGAAGVVIAHGTDTLEENAFLLDLLHDDERPVVFVGAMRARDELSWDGPVNLFSSCLVASHPAARGRGVLVVMNNTIHAASEVTKTYTEALDTFVSPNAGPLGVIDRYQPLFYRSALRRIHIPNPQEFSYVELLEANVGNQGKLVDFCVEAGCKGLVVSAMGRGNVPPLMAEALARALEKGVKVVITSRCWGGRVAPLYGYFGGGANLLEMGALFAPWYNPPKARIILGLALAAGFDDQKLRDIFDSPLPGEDHIHRGIL